MTFLTNPYSPILLVVALCVAFMVTSWLGDKRDKKRKLSSREKHKITDKE